MIPLHKSIKTVGYLGSGRIREARSPGLKQWS